VKKLRRLLGQDNETYKPKIKNIEETPESLKKKE